jgi:hypothetical protein
MNSQIFLGLILTFVILNQTECSPKPTELGSSGTSERDSNPLLTPVNKLTTSPLVSSVSLPKTKAVDEAIKILSSNSNNNGNGESEDLEGASTIILGVPLGLGVGVGYGYPGFGYGGGLYGRR